MLTLGWDMLYASGILYLARDILNALIDAAVVDVDNFNWISQLRYYWKYDDIGIYCVYIYLIPLANRQKL